MGEQSDTPRTEMAEGQGLNPYFEGRFDGESDELCALRLTLARERDEARISVAMLWAAAKLAESALADIGDSDHEPTDDLAWCELRAQRTLPVVRFALAATEAKPVNHDGLPTYDKEKALEWVAQLRDGNKEPKP